MTMTRRNDTSVTLKRDTPYVTVAINGFERVGLNLSLNPKPVNSPDSKTATTKTVRAIAVTRAAYLST
jgi:hypothetical protein